MYFTVKLTEEGSTNTAASLSQHLLQTCKHGFISHYHILLHTRSHPAATSIVRSASQNPNSRNNYVQHYVHMHNIISMLKNIPKLWSFSNDARLIFIKNVKRFLIGQCYFTMFSIGQFYFMMFLIGQCYSTSLFLIGQ